MDFAAACGVVKWRQPVNHPTNAILSRVILDSSRAIKPDGHARSNLQVGHDAGAPDRKWSGPNALGRANR